MTETSQAVLINFLLTTSISSLIGYLFHRKAERDSAKLKREFENLAQKQNNYFEWKKQTAEFLGQIYIHLNRSRLAFINKYQKLETYDQYLEDEIILISNKQIRDVILQNGHLIPPELLEDASNLVEHYDAWIAKYNTVRMINNDRKTVHIYVGPDGFRFPVEAEDKFKERYIKLFESITNSNEDKGALKTSTLS